MTRSPSEVTVDHNTIFHEGMVVLVDDGAVPGFRFTNNLMPHNTYGIFGSGQAYGNSTLAYYAPGAIVRRNVMASNSSVASRYPPDNQFPTVSAFMASFQNAAAQNYRLVAGSPYIGAGTDGKDIGCDLGSGASSVPVPAAPSGVRVM
jgi:hypothetical protein